MSIIEENLQTILEEEMEKKTKLDFMGMVPCPIKPKFREMYEEVNKKYFKETGKQFYSYVPSSCSCDDRTKSLSNILSAESEDEMPDIAVTFGLGDFVNSKIIDKFISKGVYKNVIPIEKCSYLKEVDMKDPFDAYGIFGVFPTIIMIDKKKIGNLPIPSKWEDLLNPVYKDSICIPGGHGDVASLLPLYIYKEFGNEGLKKLDNNVSNVLHGSRVAQIAGSNKSECAPIYIVSWFFAKACANENVEIIWPEDGALIDPLIMMVKKELPTDLNRIKDFLLSKEVSSMLADNYFPSTSPLIENKFPLNPKFKWIGWDYIIDNKMEVLKEEVTKDFNKYLKD